MRLSTAVEQDQPKISSMKIHSNAMKQDAHRVSSNIGDLLCTAIRLTQDNNISSQSKVSRPCHLNELSEVSGSARHRSPTDSSLLTSGKEGASSCTLTSNNLSNDPNHSSSTLILLKQNSSDKLQRSRERNRIHARKTRQRKKEQMVGLQHQAEELKKEQIRIKQSINEKNTANILVGLFSFNNCEEDKSKKSEDPQVEMLLKRSVEDIPDASKITELPALILPGQHNSKKVRLDISGHQEMHNDGIDYELLGKDRSKCTPEELDRIRRERNRMHAKRTRDRKRLFMEEMAEMCKKLREENSILQAHLESLDQRNSSNSTPSWSDSIRTSYPQLSFQGEKEKNARFDATGKIDKNGVTSDQIRTLLEAAGKFEQPSPSMFGVVSLGSMSVPVAAAVTVSENNSSAETSFSDMDDNSNQSYISSVKRRRLLDSRSDITTIVPKSITTSSTSIG